MVDNRDLGHRAVLERLQTASGKAELVNGPEFDGVPGARDIDRGPSLFVQAIPLLGDSADLAWALQCEWTE